MARNTQVAADHDAPPITRLLAEFVAGHPSRGWTDAVDHEAHRTLLNWAGCAVGAAQHESVQAALAAVALLQPAPQAAVLGRRERVDMASAALLNGISSHTFDFDDTHLKTIIHPAGPVASALLALGRFDDVAGPGRGAATAAAGDAGPGRAGELGRHGVGDGGDRDRQRPGVGDVDRVGRRRSEALKCERCERAGAWPRRAGGRVSGSPGPRRCP